MSNAIRDEVIIVIADISGSMEGAAIAKINVQLLEMLSELQSRQEISENSIRLGIMGFHEQTVWFVNPTIVSDINVLPQLTPVRGRDDLGTKSNFSQMLTDLNKHMTTEFLCNRRKLNSVHLLFFTDGCPTDRIENLNASFQKLKKNAVFSDVHTKRYVVQERSEGVKLHDRDDFIEMLAGKKENVVTADEFSVLWMDIVNELAGTQGLNSVFD